MRLDGQDYNVEAVSARHKRNASDDLGCSLKLILPNEPQCLLAVTLRLSLSESSCQSGPKGISLLTLRNRHQTSTSFLDWESAFIDIDTMGMFLRNHSQRSCADMQVRHICRPNYLIRWRFATQCASFSLRDGRRLYVQSALQAHRRESVAAAIKIPCYLVFLIVKTNYFDLKMDLGKSIHASYGSHRASCDGPRLMNECTIARSTRTRQYSLREVRLYKE